MSISASAPSRLAAESVGTAFSCVVKGHLDWTALRPGTVMPVASGLGIAPNGCRIVFLRAGSWQLELVGWANATWDGPPSAGSGSRIALAEIEVLAEPAEARGAWVEEKGPMIGATLEGVSCELRLLVAEELEEIRGIFRERPLLRSASAENTTEPAVANWIRGAETNAATRGRMTTLADAMKRHSLSISVRRVLEGAAQRRATPARALRSDALLATALEQGTRDAGAKLMGASAILAALVAERAGEGFARRLTPELETPVSSPPERTYLSRHVDGTLELAARLMENVHTSDRVLAMRHLVVAMLDFRPARGATSAHTVLRELGVKLDELRQAFLESLAEHGPEEERRHWGEYLEQGRAPIRRRAGFNADLSSGDDQLGIQRDVDAMAALIASVELQPPLSIGLFGNWGSGKSFFMGKLREALAELTKSDALAAKNGGGPANFWPNIVPIEFNAWHYIDSNLWASLVTHIFEQLRQWKQPGEAAKLQRARLDALKNLKLAQEARSDAEKQQAAAERALEKAQEAQKTANASLNTAAAKLAALTAKDVWAVVGQLPAAETEQARAKLEELGLAAGETAGSLESVYDQLKEFASSAGRFRALGLALIRGHGAKIGAAALLVSVAAAVGAGWWASAAAERLAPAITLVTQVAGFAIAAVAWVGSAAKRVSAALEPLERVRVKIESRMKVAEEEIAAERAKLEREIEQQRLALQQATDSVAAADRALQAAQAEAVDAFSGRYVARFIEQRAASVDYRKHLGLVALIREDFGRLSALIIDHNRNRAQPAAGLASGSESVAEAVAEAGDLGVNRIVLFIDDLDRCPSDRVVEVLQAIHLLLAFPLFVVVVGVDSRWVTRALLDTHPTLFGRNKDGEKVAQDDLDEALATPGDYLEKIFQIPYRLRDLDPGGTQKLLHELTKGDALPPAAAAAPVTSEAVVPGSTAGRPSESNIAEPDAEAADEDEAEPIADDSAEANSENDRTPPAVEALRLTERERTAMAELAPIIGRSPRATKRFVNTYRLLRATDARLRYDFRATMLLLAAVTGTPVLAAKLVVMLKTGAGAEKTVGEIWETLLAGSEDASAVARVRVFLKGETANAWGSLPVSSLSQAWERVAQFSFVDLDEESAEPVPR